MWCSTVLSDQANHRHLAGIADAVDVQRPLARSLLRLEGLAALILALSLYHLQGYVWSSFAWWFLLPDVALLAYLSGSARLGMWAYNATHSTLGPAALAVWSVAVGDDLGKQAALIWFAHIGFDRALGYGLKGPQDFKHTHLGCLGGGQH